MNRKEVKTLEEADEFIRPLTTGEYVIDIKELPNNAGYSIEWQPHKTYIAFGDGKEYPDELWRTEDGRLLFIQDIEESHLRNILRMILRQRRATEEYLESLMYELVGDLQESTYPDSEIEKNHSKYLH